MDYIETDAIVLSRKPYRNSSLIVSFLTRDLGRISLIVKGANRENSGMTGFFDLLNITQLRLKQSDAGFYNFISAAFSKSLLCKTNYEKSQFQIASAELVNQWFIQEFESPEYYILLVNYLKSVKTLNYPPIMLFLRLIFRVLDLSGTPINVFNIDISDTYSPYLIFNISENTLKTIKPAIKSDRIEIVLTINDLKLLNKINNINFDKSLFPNEKKAYFSLYNLLNRFILYHINSNFRLKALKTFFSSKKS